MHRIILLICCGVIGIALWGCGSEREAAPVARPPLATTQPAPAPPLVADPYPERPLYQLSEREVEQYISSVQKGEPDLHKRIVTIARKNLGQPYQIYLLGESPFETIDPEPVYCLTKSDCVVFAEHTLSMALTDSWGQFLAMLQRIRYKNGHISVLTRNHYTEADWNRNNSWLLRDITEDIGGQYVVRWKQRVDRGKFFQDRYKLQTSIPPQTIEESFIPCEHVGSIKLLLRDGDIVNFVSGKDSNYWVGHVGLVAIGADGNVNLIHSASPRVREESIDAYIARATAGAAEKDSAGKARFRGFKFLRVREDAWSNLRNLDGAGAPRVTIPKDSPLTWDQFLKSFDTGG